MTGGEFVRLPHVDDERLPGLQQGVEVRCGDFLVSLGLAETEHLRAFAWGSGVLRSPIYCIDII
jgi:hypothetical protein